MFHRWWLWRFWMNFFFFSKTDILTPKMAKMTKCKILDASWMTFCPPPRGDRIEKTTLFLCDSFLKYDACLSGYRARQRSVYHLWHRHPILVYPAIPAASNMSLQNIHRALSEHLKPCLRCETLSLTKSLINHHQFLNKGARHMAFFVFFALGAFWHLYIVKIKISKAGHWTESFVKT